MCVCSPLDVECKCGQLYCFTCKEEAHRPVDCQTVSEWNVKNCAESENLTWIIANTKPCPKCARPIQKNQGCMHMTCSQCRHEFCWLCKNDWSKHGETTGGYYACNKCAPMPPAPDLRQGSCHATIAPDMMARSGPKWPWSGTILERCTL